MYIITCICTELFPIIYFDFLTGSKQGFCAAIVGYTECMRPDLMGDYVHPYQKQALSKLMQFFFNLRDEQCNTEGMWLLLFSF